MKKLVLFSLVSIVYSVLLNQAQAIEGTIFDLKGDASIEAILQKLGAPKGASLPVIFKSGEREIKVEVQGVQTDQERIISIDFNPAYPFKASDRDLFERIETKDSGDRINHTLLIADPKTGRIWRLNSELEVAELELVTPWVPKNKLHSLKDILAKMSERKIKKIQKIKVETKK